MQKHFFHFRFICLTVFLAIHQLESVTLSQLLSVWRTETTVPPPVPVHSSKPHELHWPGFSFNYSKFKGEPFDRTESTLYPTTPQQDKDFHVWEEQEEKRYAEKLLAQMSSPNDTLIDVKTNELIARFLVDVAKGNGSSPTNPYINDIVNMTELAEFFQLDDAEEIEDRQDTRLNQRNINIKIKDRKDSPASPDENEKIVQSFLKNRPGASADQKLRQQMMANVKNFQNFVDDAMKGDAVNGLIKLIGPDNGIKGGGPTMPPLMSILQRIRVPTMPPRDEKLQGNMSRLRDNLSKGNITGALSESLKIASPTSIGSLVSGVMNLVRCNTVGMFGNRSCRNN